MSSKDLKSSSKDPSGKRKSASHRNKESLPTTEELKKSKIKDRLETGEQSEKKRVSIINEDELAREKSTSKVKSNDRGEGVERRRPRVDNEEGVGDKTDKRRDHHKSGRHRTENLVVEEKRATFEEPQNERGEHRRHKRESDDDRKHHEKKQHKIDTNQDEERRRRKHEMRADKPEKERRERIEDGPRKHKIDKDESRGVHGDPEELEEYRRRKEEKRERRLRREKEEQQAQRITVENATRDEPHDVKGPQTQADDYDDDFEAVEEHEDGSSTPSGGSLRRNSGSQVAVPDNMITAARNAVPTRGGTAGSTAVPVGLGHTSFINFKIAHKRRCHDLVANSMLTRAFDLSRLIDMDRVSYDILNVPPVLEHNQYMRLFGRAGCEHEASQTGDDSVGRECQTKQIETRPGWTQCPSGGDGEPDCGCGDSVPVHGASSVTTAAATIDGEQTSQVLELDRSSLARLTTLVETVLVEEARFEVASRHPAAAGAGDSRVSLSKGYNQYSVAEVPGAVGGNGSSGCCCTLARFPTANSNVFATVLRQHHSVPSASASASASIAVWSVSGGGGGPSVLLTCTGAAGTTAVATGPDEAAQTHCEVTCLSFSPDAGPSHVVAGLSSGVIALWDLRERARPSQHGLMPPAYMTACASDPVDAEQWSHRGPITALHTVTTTSAATAASQVSSRVSMSSESYQLLSLDSFGRLSVWLASAIPASQSGCWAVAAGSLSDLNLRPGSRFRLSRVTSIELSTNQPDCPGFLPVMTCMTTDPSNNSAVFIGTGSGQLLRHHRAADRQHRQQPRVVGDDQAFAAGAITQIDFYPFFEQYLLAGYDDGQIRIFSVSSAKAVLSFQHRAGTPVLQLRWSRSHPAVFLSLDAEGTLCVWNVLLDLFRPALVQRLPGYIGFDLSTDSRWHIKDRNSSKNSARLLLWALDGRVEVHELADAFSSPELDDSFKTASLFQSLL